MFGFGLRVRVSGLGPSRGVGRHVCEPSLSHEPTVILAYRGCSNGFQRVWVMHGSRHGKARLALPAI